MNDPRFARIKRDPRFKAIPKRLTEVKLGKRFKHSLKDPKFNLKPKFDKYGRKNEAPAVDSDEQEEQSSEKEDQVDRDSPAEEPQQQEPLSHSKQEQLKQKQKQKQQQKQRPNRRRQLEEHRPSKGVRPRQPEQSANEDDAEDVEQAQDEQQSEEAVGSEGESESEEIEYSYGVDQWEQEEQEVQEAPQIEKATRRLALMNYQWDQIQPKDLMVLFTSFLPQGGRVKQVSVYASEFGKQHLEEERKFGPRQIFKDMKIPESKLNQDVVTQVNDIIVKGNETNLDIDPIKLREYERDRLKYYYAVIEFESAATADLVYQQTNGQEFEQSSLKIDLRFIPDHLQLPEENLSSKCDSLPDALSKPNIMSRVFGHTDVKLTWEEPKNRTSFWTANPKDIDKMEFDELVASNASEDDGEKLKDLFEKVKENDTGSEDGMDWRAEFDKKKKKSNLQVKFKSGFDASRTDAGVSAQEPRHKKHFGPKQGKVDDFFVGFDEEDRDQGATNEKSSYKERKLQRKEKLRQKRQEQSELALLVDDRKKKVPVAPNPLDQRFKAIYTSANYAIDPTHKQQEVQKQGKRKTKL